MATFIAFTVGAGAASACLYEASLALDHYATAANPRRYSDKGFEPIRGPSSINLSVREWRQGGQKEGKGRITNGLESQDFILCVTRSYTVSSGGVPKQGFYLLNTEAVWVVLP